MAQNNSLFKPSTFKHYFKKLTLRLFQKLREIRIMAFFALLQKVEKHITVAANALNAHIRNVYDHHGNLSTLCSDWACSEPKPESVVGVHWSMLAQLRFPNPEHFVEG